MSLLRLQRFIAQERGVAAVEFALIAPLLLLFYCVIFEAGRGWLAQRKFHSTVENAARYAARFPEFAADVRIGLPLIVKRSITPLSSDTLNLTLISTKIEQNKPTTIFEYDFFGDASSVNWKPSVHDGMFENGESVIVVTARYSYKPLFFGPAIGNITFSDVTVVTPFFSRSYEYSKGTPRWDYFNVQ